MIFILLKWVLGYVLRANKILIIDESIIEQEYRPYKITLILMIYVGEVVRSGHRTDFSFLGGLLLEMFLAVDVLYELRLTVSREIARLAVVLPAGSAARRCLLFVSEGHRPRSGCAHPEFL